MADRQSSLDVDTFDNAPGAPSLGGVGDNIEFEDSLPANDQETSSIITEDKRDEAAEDAQDDVV
jgi:hypothetical protein